MMKLTWDDQLLYNWENGIWWEDILYKKSTVCPRKKLSKFWRHIAQKVGRIWQYPFVEQMLYVYGTIFPLSRNIVHECGFAMVQSHTTDHGLSSVSDPF